MNLQYRFFNSPNELLVYLNGKWHSTIESYDSENESMLKTSYKIKLDYSNKSAECIQGISKFKKKDTFFKNFYLPNHFSFETMQDTVLLKNWNKNNELPLQLVADSCTGIQEGNSEFCLYGLEENHFKILSYRWEKNRKIIYLMGDFYRKQGFSFNR